MDSDVWIFVEHCGEELETLVIDSYDFKCSYLSPCTLSFDSKILHTVLWSSDDGGVSFMNLSAVLDYLDWGVHKDSQEMWWHFREAFSREENQQKNIMWERIKMKLRWIWLCPGSVFHGTFISWIHCEFQVVMYVGTGVNLLGRIHPTGRDISVVYKFPSNSVS